MLLSACFQLGLAPFALKSPTSAFLGKLKTNRVDWRTEADLAVRIWLTLLRDADCTDN